ASAAPFSHPASLAAHRTAHAIAPPHRSPSPPPRHPTSLPRHSEALRATPLAPAQAILPTSPPSAGCRDGRSPCRAHPRTPPIVPASRRRASCSEHRGPFQRSSGDGRGCLPATAPAGRCLAHWLLPQALPPRWGGCPPRSVPPASAPPAGSLHTLPESGWAAPPPPSCL